LDGIGMAKARTLEGIDPEEKEIEEAMRRTPNTLHAYSMDYTYSSTYSDTESEQKQEQGEDSNGNNSNNTFDITKEPIVQEARNTFVASSATEAEERIAREGRHPDGPTPIQIVPKRVWRPKVRMEYEEPEALLDIRGGLDWLFEEHRHVGIEGKGELTPREDLIKYKTETHKQELDENVQCTMERVSIRTPNSIEGNHVKILRRLCAGGHAKAHPRI
jgi:hypothetical protein